MSSIEMISVKLDENNKRLDDLISKMERVCDPDNGILVRHEKDIDGLKMARTIIAWIVGGIGAPMLAGIGYMIVKGMGQ